MNGSTGPAGRRTPVAAFILWSELLAGVLLAFVAALTFVSVALRYVFNWSIPENYDLSRNFLGILIFWGIALAGYRGEHITVDLLWGALPPGARRIMDVFATAVAIFCIGAFAWAMGLKVLDTRDSNETTYDIHLPVWPFYAVAWIGLVAGILLLLLRLVVQLRTQAADAGTGHDAATH